MPHCNCRVSGPIGHIRYIVYFLSLKQATRPSPLLDWKIANVVIQSRELGISKCCLSFHVLCMCMTRESHVSSGHSQIMIIHSINSLLFPSLTCLNTEYIDGPAHVQVYLLPSTERMECIAPARCPDAQTADMTFQP